ncbi:TetR/AcrR family transcriptional regulator [Phenylobacterium terrae]|uniref:TetR/AcrR family transcriptional regulator n=1 Tax=Phenylobacterium terrae TaxID=2665495 RepID=A0ABW4MWV6_9CAUL
METIHRITRGELYELVWSQPLKRLAADLGISGNALAKICDRVLVPHPSRGYWSAQGGSRRECRPPLPPAPEDCGEEILISARRAASRRGLRRMSLEARREQIADAAAELVLEAGVGVVTMKAVARRAGISEALAYRYFSGVIELLAYVARREQEIMAAMQDACMKPHTTYIDRAQASMVGFLDYVAERRGLLQALLASGELRRTLSPEHRSRTAWATHVSSTKLLQQSGVPVEVGGAGWHILRASATRAGKLLARGKLSRERAGVLASAIMDGARERLLSWPRDPEAAAAAGPKGRKAPRRSSRARAGARAPDPAAS